MTIISHLNLQDLNEVQLEPDISKLRNMKRSVLRRRVVNKVKRPEKPVIPTRGTNTFIILYNVRSIFSIFNMKLMECLKL